MQAWPGLGRRSANPSQNPISPSHIGQRGNSPASSPAVSSVFMTSAAQARDAAIHSECQSRTRRLSRPDEDAIGSDSRNPMHLPGASRSVLSQGNAVDAFGGERDCNFWALRREEPGQPYHGREDAGRLSCAFPSAPLTRIRRAHGEVPKN